MCVCVCMLIREKRQERRERGERMAGAGRMGSVMRWGRVGWGRCSVQECVVLAWVGRRRCVWDYAHARGQEERKWGHANASDKGYGGDSGRVIVLEVDDRREGRRRCQRHAARGIGRGTPREGVERAATRDTLRMAMAEGHTAAAITIHRMVGRRQQAGWQRGARNAAYRRGSVHCNQGLCRTE